MHHELKGKPTKGLVESLLLFVGQVYLEAGKNAKGQADKQKDIAEL
jgi:hypothetical protein